MKSKYKLNMSSEKLASELKCILSVKYIPNFGDNIKNIYKVSQ